MWVYSLGSRAYRRVTDGAAPEWLGDGRRLLYEHRGRISIVDVASGISHEVFAMPGESVNNPQLTADNSQLFFTHSTSTGDIWIVDFSQRLGGR